MHDPIVEEVRTARREHTIKFGGDLEAICADLREIQKISGHKVVSFPADKQRENETKKAVA